MSILNRLLPVFGLLALLLVPPSLKAEEMPNGKTVLTISGQISATNIDDHFVFDLDMIRALPQHHFTTGTPWHPEKHQFSGPLLRELLARVGAEGNIIQAIALNDYKVDIPIDDAKNFDMIVALEMDGEPMSVRNKGPLFILYPFDQQHETQSQVYYNRAIWQLKAINIE